MKLIDIVTVDGELIEDCNEELPFTIIVKPKPIIVLGEEHITSDSNDINVYSEIELIIDKKNFNWFVVITLLLRVPFIICDAYYASKSNACVMQHPLKRGTKLDINLRSYLLVSSIYSLIIITTSLFVSIKNNGRIEGINKLFRFFWICVGFIGYFYNIDNLECENTFNIYMFVSISMKPFIEICTPDFYDKKCKYFF